MEIYNTFVDAFHREVHRSKKLNGLSDINCRHTWDFDAGRLLRKKNNPHTRTFFRYCFATGQCPVRMLIILLKPHLNLNDLHDFIQNELKTGN